MRADFKHGVRGDGSEKRSYQFQWQTKVRGTAHSESCGRRAAQSESSNSLLRHKQTKQSHSVVYFVFISVQATTKLNEQLAKNNHLKEKLQSLLTGRQHFQKQHNKLNKVTALILYYIHGHIADFSFNTLLAAVIKSAILCRRNCKNSSRRSQKLPTRSSLLTMKGELLRQPVKLNGRKPLWCCSSYMELIYIRVEAQSKLTMLRETAEKEHAHFNAEMRELERVIAQQSNLKDFMSIKGGERSDHKMGTRQCKRHGSHVVAYVWH